MPGLMRRLGLSAAWQLLLTLAVLWVAGVALRTTLLAVPPVIPRLQAGLRLSQTDIGIVSSLPLLLFALVAIPGAGLIARFGTIRALVIGLTLTAVAGALRAISPGAVVLFATTLVMGAGIAIMQPAMPALVRDWAPRHIGLATAVYSNGMLSAEGISAAVTLPFILPWLGGSWRWTLVFWSAPVVLAILLVKLRERDVARRAAAESGTAAAHAAAASMRRWWPDWRSVRTWKLGFIVGGASGVYFGVNAFLPGYLTSGGHADLIAGALAALNVSQIPATIVLFFLAQRIAVRRASYLVFGALATVSVVGLFVTPASWIIGWCVLMGVSCAVVITLGLTLPALLSEPGDVQRLAGGMFTVSYLCALLAPVLGGILWDRSGVAELAFAPAAACGVIIAAAGARMRFRSA
ncbi:MAG TPA: MFS transporter [Nevskiaceae bacterium]